MPAARRGRQKSSIPLGQRRGISELARFALDLTWALKGAESETAARARAYPSPPMSGSPPLPPKASHEAGDRGQAQGGYQTASEQDVYRGASTATTHADIRGQQSAPPPPVRSYAPEPPERMSYYPRPEDTMHRPPPYPPQGGSVLPQQPYMPLPGPPSSSAGYPVSARPQAAENPPYMSPKSQRKTKGHVASACVPCKRAHLR
jgi:hypothetical protein